MTAIESVCVKCRNLNAYTTGVYTNLKGVRFLVSSCCYGGKNAGNRKKCKMFSPAPARTVDERETILKGEKQ